MILEPSGEVKKAIRSLSGNADWETVRKWIKDSLGEAFIDSTKFYPGEAGAYPYLCGRVSVLKDLIRKIDKVQSGG